MQSRNVMAVLSGRRVLVVDDDPDTLTLLADLLAHEGAEPVTARNADEALQKFADARPHVIVSDITMPDGDGYQLLRRVRARLPTAGGATPAIALTANTGDLHHSRALLAGYQLHLAKPVDPTALVMAIQRLAAAP